MAISFINSAGLVGTNAYVTRTAKFHVSVRVVVHRGTTPPPESEGWHCTGFDTKWKADDLEAGSYSGTLSTGWSGELV